MLGCVPAEQGPQIWPECPRNAAQEHIRIENHCLVLLVLFCFVYSDSGLGTVVGFV